MLALFELSVDEHVCPTVQRIREMELLTAAANSEKLPVTFQSHRLFDTHCIISCWYKTVKCAEFFVY